MRQGVLTTNLYVTSLSENGILSVWCRFFFSFHFLHRTFCGITYMNMIAWWRVAWLDGCICWNRNKKGILLHISYAVFLIYKTVLVFFVCTWAGHNSLFFHKSWQVCFPSWDHDSKMIYINEDHNGTLRLVFPECSFKCNGSRNFLSCVQMWSPQ